MNKIEHSNLTKLPYISLLTSDKICNRIIPIFPIWENQEWKTPILFGNKIDMITAVPAKSDYIAKEIENSNTDIYLPFFNFFYKFITFPDLMHYFDCLSNDIHNLFKSIAKVDMFFKLGNKDSEIGDFIATEIEYIVILCKSLFDLLQIIISHIWKNVKLVKGENKKNLPETFRKMIYKDKQILSKQEIIEKYNIPEVLANYYSNIAPFYEKLKIFRDKIVHQGKISETIFVLEIGFAILNSSFLYSDYKELLIKEFAYNDRLYSIRPILYHWITNTINSCNLFSETISKIIKFSESLIKDYNIYTRSYYIKNYLKMKEELKNNPWWKS